jgi:hypothetical protein
VLTRARDIELKPFVLARAFAPERDIDAEPTAPSSTGGKAGLDAKLAVSPTLTADLTINTDFAQVEVDRQVINLSRFPLFFPEKRDFFLESGDIFAFGTSSQARLFYSRRIGVLDGQRGAHPRRHAAAMVEAAAGRLAFSTRAPVAWRTPTTPSPRVKRDLFDRSYLGGMVTHPVRARRGRCGDRLRRRRRLSARRRRSERATAFWLAGSRATGTSSTAHRLARVARLSKRPVRQLRLGVAHRLGIQSRRSASCAHRDSPVVGQLAVSSAAANSGRAASLAEADSAWNIVANYDGSLTDSRTWQTAEFEWRPLAGTLQSGDDFEFNIQRQFDAPPEEFDVFGDVTIPAGRYWFTRWQAQYSTSDARPLSGEIDASWGDYYNGRSTELQLGGTWRGGGHVILGAELNRTSATLPTGSFVALETVGRVEYAFSPRTSFLAFMQYNNEDRRADFNLRFHWIPTIGDDVYVVWNSGYTTDPDARYRFPSQRALTRPLNGALVIKAVHRFAP